MTTILLLLAFLITIYILYRKSDNKFFYQNILATKYVLYVSIVYDFNFNKPERYLEAWKYFDKNKHKYDGTTIAQDRWLMKGLEPQSLRHDYEWIMAECLKDYFQSNYEYVVDLRKANTNWLYAWGLYVGLQIVSIPHFWISKGKLC